MRGGEWRWNDTVESFCRGWKKKEVTGTVSCRVDEAEFSLNFLVFFSDDFNAEFLPYL